MTNETSETAETTQSAVGSMPLLDCRCDNDYSIESHGNGYAIYFGRCRHRHGYNIAQLTEVTRKDIIKEFELSLNQRALVGKVKKHLTDMSIYYLKQDIEINNSLSKTPEKRMSLLCKHIIEKLEGEAI